MRVCVSVHVCVVSVHVCVCNVAGRGQWDSPS